MKIPNYNIIKELGTGGMATVYLAEQILLDRKVALKVLHEDMASDSAFRKNFLAEGKIIANLEHPNIVRVYDVGITDASVMFLSMEYFSAGTLKDRIKEGKLDLAAAKHVLEGVGAGLTHAHKKGFIHRDIKPANILFHSSGRVVLSDFGIAKLQDTTGDLTRMGYIQGTLHYMSPEQATTTVLDQRSDIYSLGLVFYEMLTGEKVCNADTTVQAIYQHTTAPPPHLPHEYAEYQSVLNQALAKGPEQRFISVDQFIEGVNNPRAWSDDRTVINREQSALEKTVHAASDTSVDRGTHSEGGKKKKWLVGGLAIAISAILVTGGAAGYMQYKTFQERRLQIEQEEARQEAEQARLAREERARQEAEQKRFAEADKARQEAEQKRFAEEEKARQEAEQRRLAKEEKAKQEAKQKRQAEKKRKEAQAKRQREKEKERQRQAQKEAKAKKQQKARDAALRLQRQKEWEAKQAVQRVRAPQQKAQSQQKQEQQSPAPTAKEKDTGKSGRRLFGR